MLQSFLKVWEKIQKTLKSWMIFAFIAFTISTEEIGIMEKSIHIKTNRQEYFSPNSCFCFTSKCW